jgi:hypothetical protein
MSSPVTFARLANKAEMLKPVVGASIKRNLPTWPLQVLVNGLGVLWKIRTQRG